MFFKNVSKYLLPILIAVCLVGSYDYFIGHKFFQTQDLVGVVSSNNRVNIAAASLPEVESVTHATVVGTSAIRQLLKSPLEVSYSSDDKTPLVVSTGADTGTPSTYLAKYFNYSLGSENDLLMSLNNKGDLDVSGTVSAHKGEFDSVDTGKVSLDGSLKFKSKINDPDDSGSNNSKKYGLLWLGNNGKSLYFMDSDNAKNKVVITDSSGRVGIGTDPSRSLTVKGVYGEEIMDWYDSYGNKVGAIGPNGGFGLTPNSSVTDPFRLTGASDVVQASIEANSTQNADVFQIRSSGAAGGDLFTVEGSGRVGIGTTNPSVLLDVHAASTNSQITISTDDDGNSGNPVLALVGDANGSPVQARLGVDTSDGVFKINFGSSFNGVLNGIVIDASGNVGIGTSAPSAKLDINSDSFRLRDSKTPASSAESCDQGQIAWDSDYIYVCVSTDTWKRSSVAAW